jgi:P4 family phage/plasmid primase-like protien
MHMNGGDTLYDEQAVRDWLTLLHSQAPGLTHICSTGDWTGHAHTELEAAVRRVTYLNGEGREGIYARVTTLKAALAPGSRGGAADTLALPGLWADVDLAGPGHLHDPTKYDGRVLPPNEDAGRALIAISGLPAPTLWIHSGGGLYPIWLLDTPYILPNDDHARGALIHLAATWQKVIAAASKTIGWHYGSGVGDLARVLRIPGTVNRKAGLQRPCRIIEHTGPRYTLLDLRAALARASAALTPEPAPPSLLTVATPATASGPRTAADPGVDFNARTTWPAILTPHGWTEHYRTDDGATHWTRPGKTTDTSATTNALGTDRLHVFSTNAPPFEANESYHKFAAYTLLNHRGDYTAATRELARAGYGEQINYGARQAELLTGILGPDRAAENKPPSANEPKTVRAKGPPSRYFDANGSLFARVLADDVLTLGPVATGGDDLPWSYHGGVWSPAKHIVRNRVTELLGDRYRPTHRSTVEDIVRALARHITCDPVPDLINFSNGLLDWHIGTLRDHTPDIATTVQVGVPWRPDATCPRFDAFLTEVVPLDMVEVVWELIGYLMYSGNPLHKAVMLMGTGRNGKGTLLRAIVALLGKRNVTAVSLQDLVSTRFTTASLFGKIANIAGDIDATYLESTAIFKAITGQDQISAEHKGRDRFDFTPWAVPVFSANEIPPSSDTTVGYLSRWLLIPFPHSFIGKEDRDLDAKLHAELPGIAVKAITALRRLMDRGEFEQPESARAAQDEFARRVDQIRSWLGDCCELTPAPHDPAADPLVPRTALYQAYRQWCARDGHKAMAASKFFDRLEHAGATAAIVRGCRGFRGVRIVDQADPPRLLDTATQRIWGDTDSVGGAGGVQVGVQLFDPQLHPQMAAPPAPHNESPQVTQGPPRTDDQGGAEGAAFTNPLRTYAGDTRVYTRIGGVSEKLHPLHPPAPLINSCSVCGRELDPALAPKWHDLNIHPSCHTEAAT